MTTRSAVEALRMMRRIDQYLGPPICIVLGILKSLADRARPYQRTAPATGLGKVLVVKFWGMGSIVLTTPTLRALKAKDPACRITFLTFEHNEALCRAIHAIDRVYPYRADSPAAFLRSFVALVRFLRKEQFDVVVDLEFFANFTAIITALSGARVSVGFHTFKFWRESFYTKKVSFDYKHITEVFLKAAQALGADADGSHLDGVVGDQGLAAARLDQLLREQHVATTQPLLCVNINAGPLEYKRRWPLDYYKELIERILATFGMFKLILIGSTEEAPYVEKLMGLVTPSPNLINLCGLIDVEELGLLLRRSHLFIGNDSGPLHLAVAAGVSTVSFFGPETPALYGPRGSSHTVLYKDIPCSPCLNVYNAKENRSCHDNVCMQLISVEEAWAAVSQRLAESAVPRSLEAVGSR